MMRLILAATLALGMSSAAVAGELDNESGVTNKQTLTGTLVLRVDTRTKETAFVKTTKGLSSEAEAKALAKAAAFTKVPASNMKSELDQEGGASSWYFYSPYQSPYYTPVYNCNWYGNSYNPYYSYNYGYYNYYYYGSWWSYGR